jgi:hypothetical protein
MGSVFKDTPLEVKSFPLWNSIVPFMEQYRSLYGTATPNPIIKPAAIPNFIFNVVCN